jgi:hypothetical protein
MTSMRHVQALTVATVLVLGAAAIVGQQTRGGIRNSHDEPVVVDNPGVVFSRPINKNEHPPEGGSSGWSMNWKVHHTNKFKDLYIWVTQGGTTRQKKVDLKESRVVFELVQADGMHVDDVIVNRKGFIKKSLHLETGSVLLEVDRVPEGEQQYRYTFQPEGKDLHVRNVYADDKPICLWGDQPPTDGKCAANAMKPTTVRIVLCVEPDKENPKMCPKS